MFERAPPLIRGDCKNALKLSEKLLSSPSVWNARPREFLGNLIVRSVKNSLKLDQKLGGFWCGGAPNLGAGPGPTYIWGLLGSRDTALLTLNCCIALVSEKNPNPFP